MRLILASICLFALTGCASLGFNQTFGNDPLTGGVDAGQSLLLQVSLPPGLQRYPAHSHIPGGARKEGLETLRGYVDQQNCAMSLYNRLKLADWQLRMYQSFGYRSIYIYQKNDILAALVFHRQGLLTVIEVWTGTRLADNYTLQATLQTDNESLNSITGEEYDAVTESQGAKGTVEKWGIEERNL